MDVNDLLTLAVEAGASDLHLKVGSYPMMRVRGELIPATEEKRLDHEETVNMAAAVMSTQQRQKFKDSLEIDLAYSVPGLGRFRCNVFQQRGTIGMVLRVIPIGVRSIDDLGLPQVLKTIASEERGLVLVTGTTGSGKSTTLAALVDHVNATRCAHVVTVEDPIEFLHRDNRAIVNQREVSVDTRSFAHALRSALRQDPDVILVGEMRDYETIETALLAAETGHLVFSTLHTLDATETINRIIAVFPPHQQKQIRMQLASVLRGVISQRLLPRADGNGRAAAVEVMITTPFIRDCIVDKEKTHLIHSAIASGTTQYGDLRPLRAAAGHVRRGAAVGIEQGRVQAQSAGDLDDGRRNARSDGAERHGRLEAIIDTADHTIRAIAPVPRPSSFVPTMYYR
jgi:twitching motility protein PilT